MQTSKPGNNDKYISFDLPPLSFMFKIVGVEQDDVDQMVTARFIPLESTVHPVTLNFPPPMKSFGTNPKAFDWNWERLTYLFSLPDPAHFPALPANFTAAELATLKRFVATCQRLAGYTIINDNSSITMKTKPGEDPTVYADLPSHELFTGFSATFRQLHNQQEEASFSKVWGFLNKVAGGLEPQAAADARKVLGLWRDARADLMNKMSATLVCERLMVGSNPDAPRSLQGVVPEDLILTFNYGDSLHWGKYREEFAQLSNEDEFLENYHKYAVNTAMSELSHLYFGFAVAIEAAIR